jgi:hypothetical protein
MTVDVRSALAEGMVMVLVQFLARTPCTFNASTFNSPLAISPVMPSPLPSACVRTNSDWSCRIRASFSLTSCW